MKKHIQKVLTGLTTLSSGLVLFHFISMKISSRITGDKDYKSFKNELLTICLILTCLMTTILSLSYYTYSKSPWAKLQENYANDSPVEYRKGLLILNVQTSEYFYTGHIYVLNVIFNKNGIYFSTPVKHTNNGSNTLVFFERPLFIPWKAIKECKKLRKTNFDGQKMWIVIDRPNFVLQISLWDILKPLCITNGVPVKE